MSNKAIVSASNWFERFTKGWSALSLSLVTSAVMAGGTLIAAWLLRLYHNKTIGFDRNEMDTKPFEMKPYQVHIFLGTGNTSWPKKFEHSDIGSRAQDVLASLPKSVPKCKISACDAPIGTVLVFPDRVMYDLSHEPTSNELSAILKSHLLKDIQNTTCREDNKISVNDLGQKPVATDYVMICGHASRDSRCGYCGPKLATEFIKQRKKATNFDVYQCSHLGGHHFAGNVIIFNESGGHWLGYVRPSDVPKLISIYLNGSSKNSEQRTPRWRGAIGATKDEMQRERESCGAILDW